MSARLALGSSFVFLAAVPVLAGLGRDSGSHRTLAEAFATPQPLSTPIRLERTPRMDGVYRPEEWDLLWGQAPSQAGAPPAAPAKVVAAAAAPAMPAPVVTSAAPAALASQAPPAGQPASPAGTILSGPIGAPTQAASPIKAPNSTPYDQTPPQATAPQKPVAKPLIPTNIQAVPVPVPATAPAAVKMPAPPPPAAPAPASAAFMSWEPGKLYFAAFVAPGNDMLISIDGGNNGFLIGKDNLELRVTPGDTPTVKARILDATSSTGPVWVDAPGFAMASKAVSTAQPDGSVFVEVAVTDPGYDIVKTDLRDSVGLRVDALSSSATSPDAATPRVMSQVQLADQRISDLPDGLGAKVPAKGRSVVAGGNTTVKWLLSGSDTADVKYVEISGEGAFADKVNMLRVPSPAFDPRGQAVIDYPTRVVPDANIGYGVLKGELTGAGWVGGTVESSIRVAPTMDIVAPARQVKAATKPTRLTCSADIVSNTDQRIEGNFQVVPPAGWRVIDGTDKDFFIYDKGAKAMRQFVLQVPPDAHGTFETKIKLMALGQVIEKPYWITIL